MNIICPTVLATNTQEYNALIDNLDFASRIHLDVMDGEFAKPKSVSLAQLHWPESKHADIHMMVNDPASHVETLIALKANLIILHAEAETFSEAFEGLKEFDQKVGVALLQETAPEDVPEIARADHCLIFGGKLGSYGGTADISHLQKIQTIKSMNPQITIGWDGGANEDNVEQLVGAGVSVVNVGGAIQKAESPKDAYATLVAKVN